ncbi:hypothetical protein SCLCIDRAFT_1222604, partial [Scleroderma citrinum Foug A]
MRRYHEPFPGSASDGTGVREIDPHSPVGGGAPAVLVHGLPPFRGAVELDTSVEGVGTNWSTTIGLCD